ncbi:sulfurtransferase [Virgibacillus pantothenticus]|uniref:sulfurtransferase n=1 Tax=Virgibacillus pantothenticus TaxID=1473 RepID=UPI0020148F2E|nr:sulfurtransferase [Virgibacillus pantothenticus]
MELLVIGIVAFILYVVYKRYIPVRGVRSIEKDKLIAHSDHTVLVDLRDYNTSYKDKLDQALCLPLAYLNRHYQDIPGCSVILVASSKVEKNMATRFLRNKGFSVKGYYFIG